MLYEFKSKAAGTVVMTQPIAEQLLAIIGKPPAPAGVFEPQALGPAIAALSAAVEKEKQAGTAGKTDKEKDDEGSEDPSKRIGLAQRAWPLIELFKAAQAARERVTWGV